MWKKNNHQVVYTEMDEEGKKPFKIRYFVYGSLILILHIILLVIESVADFKVTAILDHFFSATMFMGIALGILYLARVFTLRPEINADSLLLNMENYSIKVKERKEEIKKSFSIILILAFALFVMEFTSIVYFGLTVYSYGPEFLNVFSLVLAILTALILLASLISLPREHELYKQIIIKEKKEN